MRNAPLRPMLYAAIATIWLAGPSATAALAQEVIEVEPGPAVEDSETPAADGNLLPPAYDGQMMRLAEILGALHYLRELCGAEEGQLWREQMEALIDKEEPGEARRARLVARFNRGFRTYREIYRDCTPIAAEAANRYLRQGTRLAGEIPSRYGR